jgi:hypothetical protein
MRITNAHMRPFHDEYNSRKACNDAHSCPIVRIGVRGIYLTAMQWKCLPVPTDSSGKPAIHYTTVYKVFAKWADDGSLWRAFIASVRHLAAEKHLDTSVLHGDGTNTVAKKGGMALATQGTNTRRARRSLPSSTIMATS